MAASAFVSYSALLECDIGMSLCLSVHPSITRWCMVLIQKLIVRSCTFHSQVAQGSSFFETNLHTGHRDS